MKKVTKKNLKIYKTLIKLQKQQINELRINLKQILDQTDQLQEKLKNLTQTQEQALDTISNNIHLGFTFSQLQQQLDAQKQIIIVKIKTLQIQEDKLRDELANEYRTLKTVEIIGDKSKQQYQKQLEREESKNLDEISNRSRSN